MRVFTICSGTALLLLFACAGSREAPSSPAPRSAAAVSWRPWGDAAFAEARRDKKLVFVDAGIEGCTACRWMHEITLKDARVIEKLEASFVSVSIDADAQPDLGSRFEEWGWPALVFLDADGNIVRAIRGNKIPENFLPILDELARNPAGPAGGAARPPPEGEVCSLVRARFDRLMAEENKAGSRIVSASPVLADLGSSKPEDVARALATVDGHAKVIDPVWGGVFVGTHSASWTDEAAIIPEKRTDHEAWALRTFAAAYALRRDERDISAAKHVDRYMREMMMAPDGTFYSTQQDEPVNLPRDMNARAYFKLDDAQRRAIGVPPIDHAVYTDQNARMIEAYAAMADATGDAAWSAVASRAATALLAARTHPDGYVLQVSADGAVKDDARKRALRIDDRPYLKPNAAFGKALVALFSSTGDARFLDAADRIARALVVLEDTEGSDGSEGGGFYASTQRDDATRARAKPYADNIAAARFLLALSQIHHDDAQLERARRTLKAVVTNAAVVELGPTSLAETLFALDELGRGIVDVSVTTPSPAPGPAAPAADMSTVRTLVDASRAAPAPGTKVVRLDVEGRYPKSKTSTAFVCTRNTCSRPISDPAHVAKEIARAQRPPSECPLK